MNSKKSATVGLGGFLGALLLLLPGCGGGGGSPTESSVFIPDIPNVSWIESGKPTHRFVFFDAQPNVEHSNFAGNEFPREGAAPNPLTGAYTGREVHFTIDRSGQAVLYQGQFRDQNTMVLTSTAGGLTLVRGTN